MKLIHSIKENCKVCYACIRVCPAKALKIEDGYSQVIEDRCIGCGNCVTACTPKALVYYDSTNDVRALLKSEKKVVAICAPSIAGEFPDITSRRNFVGMIKALGFSHVCEVAFGADLVAHKYRELLSNFKGKYYITTNCPAVVNYVEKYHPQTIPNLAPIIPPMAATAKVVRDKYGPEVSVVYIGPCTAAKRDALRFEGDAKIDAVITFVELRRMFKEAGITEITVEYSDFDPPKGGKGTLFPISHGLFQSVGINEDLLTGRLIITEGRSNFIEAIKEFEDLQELKKHLDIFYCDGGCTMGPGTSPGGKKFHRRTLVIEYTKKRLLEDQTAWKKNLDQYINLDLSRKFTSKDQRIKPSGEDQIIQVLKTLGKHTEEDYLDCGACGYDTCREFANAITHGLARPEMCIIHSIQQKQDNIKNLKIANEKLEKTRQALEDSERIAQIEKQAYEEASVITNIMLQKIPSGVVIVDKDLKITHSNQCFINLLGEDAEAINEVIPGLKGADLKTLLPPNVVQFFQYAINSEEGVENRDISIGEQLLNLSVFPLKKGEIAGAIIRDMYLPDVRREEVIHRITEVIDKNLNMVQNIGFLLGEGASQTERMLNSIMNSYKSEKK